jgi:hypothetical protein
MTGELNVERMATVERRCAKMEKATEAASSM